MSLTISYVSDGSSNQFPVAIFDHFIKVILVESSNGINMYIKLLDLLKDLKLEVDDIRGQGYDNGSNMKGHTFDVPARLLKDNPQAFFVPCTCHNLNLILSNIDKSCTDAVCFFGTCIKYMYFFAAST